MKVDKKITYLDGWRGLAISFLMIGHFFSYWRYRFGTFGVDLFFVLSGLLMTRLLFTEQTPIPLFYKRRISRIFPTFYFFVAALLTAYAVLHLYLPWEDVLGAVFFIRNYFPVGFTDAITLDHIWSLSVEEHSYILLSLIAWVSRKRGVSAKLMIAICLCLFAIASCFYTLTMPAKDLYMTWLVHSEVSAFGIFASALLYLCLHDKAAMRIHPLVFPALFLLSACFYYYLVPIGPLQLVGVSLLALLVNILREAPSWMHAILNVRALRYAGVCSFSIYLWQQPFFALKHAGYLSPPLAFFAAIIAGLLSYYLVEQPTRNFLNKNWARR